MDYSIVIPAYNEADKISSSLTQAVNFMKTFTDTFEIIVVDNNSTDNTVSIAQSFPITVIHEKDQGTIPTRNRGFNRAKFDIIARTDADTEVPYTWIAQIKIYMSQNNCDAVLGTLYYKGAPAIINAPLYTGFVEYFNKFFGVYPLFGPNMAISRKIWKKVKSRLCNDAAEVHEDIDLALHIKKIGGTVCFDRKNITRTSTRRLIHNPQSFFLEYPQRLLKMKQTHLS